MSRNGLSKTVQCVGHPAALDPASIDMKIEPFAGFIAERVRRSMKQATTKARA